MKKPKEGVNNYFYNIGYEGLSSAQFFGMLRNLGIKQLIDVRNNSWSFKKGFTGKALKERCEQEGIAYHHLPEAGIPSYIRKDEQFQDKKKLWLKYELDLLRPETVQQVAELIQKELSCLMCLEREALDCHRHILSRKVAKLSGMQEVRGACNGSNSRHSDTLAQ